MPRSCNFIGSIRSLDEGYTGAGGCGISWIVISNSFGKQIVSGGPCKDLHGQYDEVGMWLDWVSEDRNYMIRTQLVIAFSAFHSPYDPVWIMTACTNAYGDMTLLRALKEPLLSGV
jgi:hypothetical protein